MQGRLDTVSVEFDKMSFPSIQVRKDTHPPSDPCTRILYHIIAYHTGPLRITAAVLCTSVPPRFTYYRYAPGTPQLLLL